MTALQSSGSPLRTLSLAAALACGCATPAHPAPAGAAPGGTIRLALPPSLERDRAGYQEDIEAALGRVAAWFGEQGLAVDPRELVDSAFVFADVPEAKRALAQRFGIPEEGIPDSFSGTVEGTTLLVVSRETYASTYARLYPDQRWPADAYRSLVTHEIAHRAHALKAKAIAGSEEAMGPRWFFEGLAMACASQFAEPASGALAWDELRALIAQDAAKPLSYPSYAKMFRSAAGRAPVSWLVEHAGQDAFVEQLQGKYAAAPKP